MIYRLSFTIPALPSMSNIASGKSHWSHAHREVNRWKNLVFLATKDYIPTSPLKYYSLHLIRRSSSEPDFDGLVRGFKSIVDGLKYSGVILDDKISNSGVWNCEWQKVKPKQGSIYVCVTERQL